MIGEYLWDLVKLWFWLLVIALIVACTKDVWWPLEWVSLPITVPGLLLYIGFSSLPTAEVSGPMAVVIMLLGFIWFELMLHGAKK